MSEVTEMRQEDVIELQNTIISRVKQQLEDASRVIKSVDDNFDVIKCDCSYKIHQCASCSVESDLRNYFKKYPKE